MSNVIIRSDESNAAATALALAARGHSVSLQAASPLPGVQNFNYLGAHRAVNFLSLEELDPAAETVAVVFAEGESVEAGILAVFEYSIPDLLVIIGGGIPAAVEASEVAQRIGFDPSRVLLIAAFVVNGNVAAVKSEKQNVLSGFLGFPTPSHVHALAQTVFPHIAIGDAFEAVLTSTNAFFHLPQMIFNAMSVERGDDVRMYVEGFGDCVSKLLLQLDIDRLALGEALGRDLIPIETISDRYRGIADNDGRSLKEKINSRVSTQSAKLPSTFRHRFLAHELRSTFAPMYQVARLLRVNVPTIQAVVTLGQLLIGEDLYDESALAATRFLGLINAKSESLR